MDREPSVDVLDCIFDGEPMPDADLASLRRLFAALDLDGANFPAPLPRADLAAILAGDAPRTSPVTATPAPRPIRARGLKLVRHRLAAAVAAVAAALTLGSGLAVAQALPAPAQHLVDAALDHVGIHLGDDRSQPATHSSGDGPTVAPAPNTPQATQPVAGASSSSGAVGSADARTAPPVTVPTPSVPVIPVPGGTSGNPPVTAPAIAIPTLPYLPL